MNWYYSIEGCAHGPVTERGLAELARTGKVGAATLVWHPGLDEWQPVLELKPEILGNAAAVAAARRTPTRDHAAAAAASEPAPQEAGLDRAPAGILKRLFGRAAKGKE